MKVVYCGGCNPHLDRAALGRELQADERLRDLDVVVYISGCQRSCRAGRRLSLDTPGAVVVAGEHLNGRPLPVADIAANIRRALGVD